MAKYITLATCNCGQSGGAKEFVSCIQAHVHFCFVAHVVLLPDKILQVGRSQKPKLLASCQELGRRLALLPR
jgi:hypothetical protein